MKHDPADLTCSPGFGSEEVRNQVAGHLESRTYRNSYQHQRIDLDIPGLVLRQAPEDALVIKQINLMGANADPAANVSLPPEAHDKITALPDVEALNQEYQLASESVKQKYGGVQNAPEADPQVQDCKRKMLKLRAKKEFYRSQMKSRLREEFFEQKNIMLIEAQLNKTDATSPPPPAPAPWIPPMPERAELASLEPSVDMRSPDMLDSRVAAVQAMTDLCGRTEVAERSSIKREAIKQQCLSQGGVVDPAEVVEADAFPVRCHELQCLFCIGDGNLILKHRTRIFCRLQKLWEHAEKHLERLSGREILCPHPRCKDLTVTLDSVEHLLNHAQREHNIRLRCR
jgi:hypothetical protein